MKRNRIYTGAAGNIVTEVFSQERLSLDCIRLFDTYFYNTAVWYLNIIFLCKGVVIVLSEFRCVNCAVQQPNENSLTKASSLPI